MKRILIALLVGGALFAAVFGAAASLAVGGGTVQVGSDATLACDTNGVTVSYNIDYRGVVTSVQVNGIDAACAGNRLVVVLKDGSGTMIATGGKISPATGGFPITPMPTLLFTNLGNAPCDSTSCKVQLAAVDANGSPVPASPGDNHGVSGALIEKVVIMIEGDNP